MLLLCGVQHDDDDVVPAAWPRGRLSVTRSSDLAFLAGDKKISGSREERRGGGGKSVERKTPHNNILTLDGGNHEEGARSFT